MVESKTFHYSAIDKSFCTSSRHDAVKIGNLSPRWVSGCQKSALARMLQAPARGRENRNEKKSSRFRPIDQQTRHNVSMRLYDSTFLKVFSLCDILRSSRTAKRLPQFLHRVFFRVFHYSARAPKVHRDEIRMRLFTARHRHVSFDRLKIFASVAVFFSRKVQLRRAERVFRVFLALR